MPQITQDIIVASLRGLIAPESIEGVAITATPQGARVSVSVQIAPHQAEAMEVTRAKAEKTIAKLPGVAEVGVILTAHRQAPKLAPQDRPQRKPATIHLPTVKHIVAIASGKGGVGKSATAVNLAVAFRQNGLRVGLLDADIYGPSVPRLLNLAGKPHVTNEKKLVPMQQYGLEVMSMGFLVAEDAPMIWRGPMVHSALTQMFRDVQWGELDVMVVDLPPGTGDAQLTMAQSVEMAGAVIVSTPQDIALIDARKGLNMFRQTGVPVLGIVENMSYFSCPHCGERSDIFGHGGAREEAAKLGLPFLGEVPLDIAVRQTSDNGKPITEAQPDGALAKTYRDIATAVWTAINVNPQ